MTKSEVAARYPSYLTLDRLIDAAGAPGAGFCTACLTGIYPVEIPVELSKGVLELEPTKPSSSEVGAAPGAPGAASRVITIT